MSVVNELFEPFDRLSFLFQIQIPAEKKHHWDARAAEGVETAEEEEGGEEVLQDGLGGDAAQEEEKEEDNQPVHQLTCFIPTDPCCSSSLWKNIFFITWLGWFLLIFKEIYVHDHDILLCILGTLNAYSWKCLWMFKETSLIMFNENTHQCF